MPIRACLLKKHARLLNADFNPILQAGQRFYPITGRRTPFRSAQAGVTSTGPRTTGAVRRRHAVLFQENALGQERRSSARNPNRYDTSIWVSQLKVDDAFRVQYAIACETPTSTIWDNNFGQNYSARRQRLKILTLNLHYYQEENQDAKFSQIARAIDDLDIDIVCLQEVGENWNEGQGDWNSNAARIIRDRLRGHYHLHTDWSHLGFDRYREGIAVLSKYDFVMNDAGYVSSSQDCTASTPARW